MFAPRQDWDTLTAQFSAEGRVRIPNALPQDVAESLHQQLATIPYALMVSVNGRGQALAPADLESLDERGRVALQQQVHQDAARGSGFAYDGHQLRGSTDPSLRAILDRLNAPETLERVRQITGISELTHMDGQATRYLPGHFLTRHLDDPQGEQRRVAFVLSLTKQWHPDWGGLLQFYERDGTPLDAWAPAFNALTLFNVRQHIHSVTFIAPFAQAPRLSITGWVRTGAPQ